MNKSLPSASLVVDVPFFDVDAMQVVWHGHYVKYLEQARCELLRLFDYDYPDMEASGYLWPIVDMRIKYVGSARMADKINIEARLVEYETRLRIDYLITDLATGRKLTKANTIQVAVCKQSGEMQYASPQVLLDKLAAWL